MKKLWPAAKWCMLQIHSWVLAVTDTSQVSIIINIFRNVMAGTQKLANDCMLKLQF